MFEPASDYIVIEQVERASDIVLPDTAEACDELARVVRAGPGRTTDFGAFLPMDEKIKPGAIIRVNVVIGAAVAFTDNKKKYYVIKQRDVMGFEI